MAIDMEYVHNRNVFEVLVALGSKWTLRRVKSWELLRNMSDKTQPFRLITLAAPDLGFSLSRFRCFGNTQSTKALRILKASVIATSLHDNVEAFVDGA
jgi:hypothetical protein